MIYLLTVLGGLVEQRLQRARAVDEMEPGGWSIQHQRGSSNFWIRDAAGDELAEVGTLPDAQHIADWSPSLTVRLLETELELIHQHREIPLGHCNSCHATPFPCSVIRNRAQAWGIKETDYAHAD